MSFWVATNARMFIWVSTNEVLSRKTSLQANASFFPTNITMALIFIRAFVAKHLLIFNRAFVAKIFLNNFDQNKQTTKSIIFGGEKNQSKDILNHQQLISPPNQAILFNSS